MTILLILVLTVPGILGWIYEIQNETEEDRKKKLWMFQHGFYV